MKRGFVAALVFTLGAALATGAGQRLEPLMEERSEESSLLYLPKGRYLRAASLGQSAILADMVYLWAIQYYSNYTRSDRYKYVEHVFGNVVAELDPNYVDPYWLGSLILSVEARDLDGALRLLDKGFANNPDSWVLPHLAGWECRFAGRFEEAAEYFRKAATVPGAPRSLSRMAAGMLKLGGSLEEALQTWVEIRDDPESDPESVAIATRQARDLTIRIDLQQLRQVIERFRIENGRVPRSLEELVRRRYLRDVPLDPDGDPYVLDPATGQVSSQAGRVLAKR